MRLAVPDLIDDFCLNLMDWGSNNVLAVALHNSVYLWDASNGCVPELVTIDDESGPVTSVSWAPHGLQIAIGLENSEVQIWDFTSNQLVRSFRNGHSLRVGSLVWNNDILTTGGMDGKIINNDVRLSSHIVEIYQGHHNEVCGLKWSESGRKLASGGSDGLVYIWDRSMASRSSPTQWLHRLGDHTGSVKALAWSPFQPDLLASGGGEDDGTIKFWNTHTGVCLDSSGTGSLVSGLLWNKSEKELLSSHGGMRNQLSVWKYQRMLKMADLTAMQSESFSLLRVQMDSKWHLQDQMKLYEFGMCLGPLNQLKLCQKHIMSHFLSLAAAI